MTCCPCASTLIVAPVPTPLPGPGQPGGTLPAGTDPGQFLQWNGVLWVPSSWTLPSSADVADVGSSLTITAAGVSDWVAQAPSLVHYSFGASQIAVGTTLLFPWYEVAASTAAPAGALQIVRDGTLRGLRATHDTPTAADTLVYTIVNGGVPTAFTISLSSGSASGSALALSLAVLAGDLITVRSTGATGARTVRATIQFYLEVTA